MPPFDTELPYSYRSIGRTDVNLLLEEEQVSALATDKQVIIHLNSIP